MAVVASAVIPVHSVIHLLHLHLGTGVDESVQSGSYLPHRIEGEEPTLLVALIVVYGNLEAGTVLQFEDVSSVLPESPEDVVMAPRVCHFPLDLGVNPIFLPVAVVPDHLPVVPIPVEFRVHLQVYAVIRVIAVLVRIAARGVQLTVVSEGSRAEYD